MAIEETSSPAAQQSRRDEERGSNWQRTVTQKPYVMTTRQERDIKKFFFVLYAPFPIFPFTPV
jgi:hypothetical protein